MTSIPPPPPPPPPPSTPPPPPPGAAHPSAALLDHYAGGRADGASAAAIELHLQVCEVCRTMVNTAVSPERLAGNWSVVDATLDMPRRRLPERVIVRLGVPADVARLMGATPTLRRSWFVAVLVAVLFGLSAADPDRAESSIAVLLALAPLVPVAGVALAYGPGVDPAHDITLVTAYDGFRLVLVRAAAVLATSIGVAGALSLLVVTRAPLAAAWLLPALGLAMVCLALMTVLPPRLAAVVTGGTWLGAVVVASGAARDALAPFGLPGQVTMLLVGAAATIVLVARRGAFDDGSVTEGGRR